jgi:hypothetical protein
MRSIADRIINLLIYCTQTSIGRSQLLDRWALARENAFQSIGQTGNVINTLNIQACARMNDQKPDCLIDRQACSAV